MRNNRWIVLLVGLLACGLLAAGCGDDDESTTTPAATEETAAEDTTAADDTEESTTEETTEDTGDTGATPDDVYNACVDVIEGTAAEEAALPSCEQARNAFEQCLQQAEAAGGDAADAALGICQQAADQAITTLESAG